MTSTACPVPRLRPPTASLSEGCSAINNNGRFRYTGQVWLPELGLSYYKARMYSPTIGRFMQTDPIGYADGMNMYAYVGNDPVNGVDPSGLAVVCTGSRIPHPDGPNGRPYNCDHAPGAFGRSRLMEQASGGGGGGRECAGGGGTEIVVCGTLPDPIPSGALLPNFRPGLGGGALMLLASGVPQSEGPCPVPSGSPGNVSLQGTLTGVADVVGGYKFSGTLTDTRPGGLTVSFEATGVAVGFSGGSYDVQGTVPGFGALDSTFQISFFSVGYGGFGVSGARISRGDLGPVGAIGQIQVSNGLFAPFPVSGTTMKFNGGVSRYLTNQRFGC